MRRVQRGCGNLRVAAVDQHLNGCLAPQNDFVGKVGWNANADLCAAGEHLIAERLLVVNPLGYLERTRIGESLDEFAGFAATVEIEHDGRDVLHLRVDRVAEHQELEHRNQQHEHQRRRLPPDVG